jgi:hypothetical protein
LDSEVQEKLLKLEDQGAMRFFSERRLRPLIQIGDPRRQMRELVPPRCQMITRLAFSFGTRLTPVSHRPHLEGGLDLQPLQQVVEPRVPYHPVREWGGLRPR